MKKIFIILLFLLTIIKVNAYENDYFYIDIPKEYTLNDNNKNVFKWDKNNNYYAITLASNEEKKYNIKYFSDKDIENQKYYIIQGINSRLSSYNIKATVTSIKKKNIDDLYFLEYDLYLPSKKITGYDMYQKGRVYSTNNYLITLIFNSDKQIIDNNEYNNVIKSFKIKDITIDRNVKNYAIAAIIIGSVLGIIGAIIGVRKKQ